MTPLTLTLRHVAQSASLEERVRDSVQRLERSNGRIAHCHLTVEGPVPSDAHAAYAVKLELSLPGACIRADTGPQSDVFRALRAAFDDAKRQLQSLRWDH